MIGVLADVNLEVDALATDIAAHVQDAFAVFGFFIEEQGFFFAVFDDGKFQLDFVLLRLVFDDGALNEVAALIHRIDVFCSISASSPDSFSISRSTSI